MSQTVTLKKPEAMIFDMDGTLFQTESLLIPVYHRMFDILREEGHHEGPTPPDELMLGCLGMLLPDIWNKVIPNATDAAKARADELLLQLEIEGLKAGSGVLYPGVKETLHALHDMGVRLFVASNGLEHYVKGVAEIHQVTELFDDLYSAGEFSTASKVDLVKLLLDKHNISSAWMVGDRSSDVEAGIENGQVAIGCAYAGFGNEDELKGASVLINDFTELLHLYKNAE